MASIILAVCLIDLKRIHHVNHTTVFYLALPGSSFSELNTITRNPAMKLKSLHKEGGIVLGCLEITPTPKEHLGGMIHQAYKVKPTYHLKSNSYNFNMTELPFQTYVSFLTETDVEKIIPTLPELRGYGGCVELFKDVLNHIPVKAVKNFLFDTLRAAISGTFDAKKLFDALTNFGIEIEDLSRIHNHMLIIATLVNNETIKAFLDTTLDKIKIDERIETLHSVQI